MIDLDEMPPKDTRQKEEGRQTKYIWLAHKKTEDNTLNAPCRKYVETICLSSLNVRAQMG